MKKTIAQIKKEINDCDYKIYFLTFQIAKLSLETANLEFEAYMKLSIEAKKQWSSYVAQSAEAKIFSQISSENFNIYIKGKKYVRK